MMFLRRGMTLALKAKPNIICSFCSKVTNSILDKQTKKDVDSYPSENLHLSPLFREAKARPTGYDIELVDDESWRLSSGLAQAWRDEKSSSSSKKQVEDSAGISKDPDDDFDDIDGMRIRGNLFYKIDRGSKEYEEYSFDFHRRKKTPKRNDDNDPIKGLKENPSREKNDAPKQSQKKQSDAAAEVEDIGKTKKRTPTFNQLTDPYHKPFCLDIQVSKSSVRACVVHRVTSKVVAVAHSISKDMKLDLSSTRDATACEAVGSVLAQRALADDIHDLVYTPRKGERLEGKLELVLCSIIDNGINVNVKIKQRKFKKPAFFPKHPMA